MKRIISIAILLSIAFFRGESSQPAGDTTIYLITCAPGTATYSIYGHSALRVVIEPGQSDIVYNWGVFDFSTPNFAWKFAKGRLNYMLGAYPFERFMQEYFFEKRSVWSQKVNLEPAEKYQLLELISINMLKENRTYRYDFFYDDCSTRIRDLLEKVTEGKLIYPTEDTENDPTFRQQLNEYQKPYPWLKLGIDLLMGSQGERKASFRDRMFLPLEMQRNLAAAVVNRDRKMMPLLNPSETLLEFDPPASLTPFYLTPLFIFSLLLIVIAMISVTYRNSLIMNYIDILLFFLFAVLAIMMLFFNFFTDHQQMKLNMNIIWFNPFVLPALVSLVRRKPGLVWFRIVFFLSLFFIPLFFVFPGAINLSFVPVIVLISLRSFARADFEWNPFRTQV